MPKAFIIRIKYGGLGDHLFYSHLPRIAKKHGGYDFVFVSTLSEFRNEAYRTLVWEMNPYVDGYFDGDADYPEFEQVPEGMNLLDVIMRARGLDDGERFHEPEVYYQPKTLPDYANAKIYDPNFVSNVGAISTDRLHAFFTQEGTPQFQLRAQERSFPHAAGSSQPLETTSLLNYCDLIHSCAKFYCLTSGGATLAAALKKPCTAFYGTGQKPMFHHSNLHTYVDLSAGVS